MCSEMTFYMLYCDWYSSVFPPCCPSPPPLSPPSIQAVPVSVWFQCSPAPKLCSRGSGRGREWTKNPIHAAWAKETQVQLTLKTMEVFNWSHLPLLKQPEVGGDRSAVTACSALGLSIVSQCRHQAWALPWGTSKGDCEHLLKATLSFYLLTLGAEAAASNEEWEFMLKAPSHRVPKRLSSGGI